MPRPISWQPRLREIHRLVSESPRDPYHRADLEKLFRVKERAAQSLLEQMPRQNVGSSIVVERVDLLDFLNCATDAEDLPAFLAQLRAKPPKPRRRKLRAYVPRDFQPGNLRSLALTIRMRRGHIELLFDTLEQLVSQLHQLATVVETPEFERRFCRPVDLSPSAQQDRDEVDKLFEELRQLEAGNSAATTNR